MLNPAARLLWRGRDAAQLELGTRAVTIDGVEPAALARLVPTSRTPHLDTSMTALDDGTIDVLSDAGYVWTRRERLDDPRLHPPAPRLAGELAALSARRGEGAAEVLAARRLKTVGIHGTGRAAAHIAALVAAAGVGRVYVVDTGDVHLHQATPGGLTPEDEGRRFAAAAATAVWRAAPEADTTPLPMGERPDLVVMAFDEPIDSDQRAALHARGCTHLAVRLAADHGVIGPLVIPAVTSCLACADLHRGNRDPAWRALAVQLTVPRRHGPMSEVSLAAVVAGVAALQVVAYLDGEQPATIEGTLEMHLPDWRIRRRSWPRHPDCDCSHW